MGRGATKRPWVTVVGVVGDERHNGITAAVKEKFYRPHSQFHLSTGNAGPRDDAGGARPRAIPPAGGPVRASLRAMDPSLPLAGVRTDGRRGERIDGHCRARPARC